MRSEEFDLLGTTNLRLLYLLHQSAFSFVMIVFRQNRLWRQYCFAWNRFSLKFQSSDCVFQPIPPGPMSTNYTELASYDPSLSLSYILCLLWQIYLPAGMTDAKGQVPSPQGDPTSLAPPRCSVALFPPEIYFIQIHRAWLAKVTWSSMM